MKNHWPLGRGNYARSLIHSSLAAGIAVFFLLLGIAVLVQERSDRDLALAYTLWTFVAFLAIALRAATLMIFRPSVLALLLPMPCDEGQMYEVLDPLRSAGYRLLPYVSGIVAMAPCARWGPWEFVIGVFCACTLFQNSCHLAMLLERKA